MTIFESLPAFLGFVVPSSALVLIGIIFEERIAEAEQRLFKKIKRALRARKQR